MSKFKVGDKVRVAGYDQLNHHGGGARWNGAEGVVHFVSGNAYSFKIEKPLNGYSSGTVVGFSGNFLEPASPSEEFIPDTWE